jgi:hypothetical protein
MVAAQRHDQDQGCEAGDPIALRLAAELLEEAGRTNEAAQLRQYGLEPASRIVNEWHQRSACSSHLPDRTALLHVHSYSHASARHDT